VSGFYDLREYLEHLENGGLLKRVKKRVNRDWEIAAVCRELFFIQSSEDRPGLLFEDVEGFENPLAVGILGGSKKIYAAALGISAENILSDLSEKWAKAVENPIKHTVVNSGPCKEKILTGKDVDLFSFPHPFWNVGLDPGYFLTAPCVFSKEPETEKTNIGCYRIQIKDKNKAGIHFSGSFRHLFKHWTKNKQRGHATPVAIILGADPSILWTAVSGIPEGVDELGVAGRMRGGAVETVKCETVDLEVPASAEIVIEGEIMPNYLEEEGPFGEYTGYMGAVGDSPVIQVSCITHRGMPVYHSFVEGMPPCESSLVRSYGREASVFYHLKKRLGLPVKDVHVTESGGAAAFLIIALEGNNPGLFWETVWGAWSVQPSLGKWTIVVDGDIDIRNSFQVEWALSYRVRPDRDIFIEKNVPPVPLDPSCLKMAGELVPQAAKVAVNCMIKHKYPPFALPPAEHIEIVRSMWDQYGF